MSEPRLTNTQRIVPRHVRLFTLLPARGVQGEQIRLARAQPGPEELFRWWNTHTTTSASKGSALALLAFHVKE